MPTPSLDMPKPRLANMVPLPFQPEVYLCSNTRTRWILDKGELHRDLEGEEGWAKMADYVGKTYQDVFMDSYRHTLNTTK
jgi:hypothetical protein